MIKKIRYFLEFIFVSGFVFFFSRLPFEKASNLGGRLGRWLGPFARQTRIARENLEKTFPEKSSEEIETIIQGVWENLGRTMAEYPHVAHIDFFSENSPVEIVNAHIIDQLRDDQKPGLLFLGHLANWEYATLPLLRKKVPVAQLYRTLNNPYVARLIGKVHGAIAEELVTKGGQGARQMLTILSRGDHISMLVDQKLNEGVLIPFLGREAYTAPAIARLALKFNCPLVPVRVERLGGARCRVTYYDPIPHPTEGTLEEKTRVLLTAVNDHLSSWVRERPQDWMWIHNRWPR